MASIPKPCRMVVGGGAGPVHAAAVAMELGVREVIVPRQSGVFCAVGMLFADLKHDLVRSYCASGEQLDPERIGGSSSPPWPRKAAARCCRKGRVRRRWRYATPRISATCARSTSSTCRWTRAWRTVWKWTRCTPCFDALHERRFGYGLPEEVLEVVNLRVRCVARRPRPALPRVRVAGTATPSARRCAAGVQPGGDVFPGLRRVPRRDLGRRLQLAGTGHRRVAADHSCGAFGVRPAPRRGGQFRPDRSVALPLVRSHEVFRHRAQRSPYGHELAYEIIISSRFHPQVSRHLHSGLDKYRCAR